MANLASHVGLYSKALDLRAQRHQVLASNIANADTPHYKARDFDFREAMSGALASREGSVSLARTSNRHIEGTMGGISSHLKYRTETQSAVDGNTVDMDVERAQIADNAIQYQILTQFISDKFQGLRSAMSGTQG